MRLMGYDEAVGMVQGESDLSSADPEAVRGMLQEVRSSGDAAVAEMARKLGDPVPVEISLAESPDSLSFRSRELLVMAASNLRIFAERTMRAFSPFCIDYDGHRAGLRWMPVRRAGCYVPGGRFPLASTALMTVVFARVSGVEEIVVCSPDSSPEVLEACRIAGADRFFLVGGAQAVAAMAFGTETVPRCDVIAGPGNAWVTEAKRQVVGLVGIDMLAGPSEVAVVIDGSADPAMTAADLLAQAEHDDDASSWLVSTSSEAAVRVMGRVADLAGELGMEIRQRVRAVKAANVPQAAEFCNMLAPEHLQLSLRDHERWEDLFMNYGALFVGARTSVPMGDYAAGPNHTLPTGSTARFSGGLTPAVFLRAQARVENSGGKLPEIAAGMAEIEGLKAHGLSCTLRQ